MSTVILKSPMLIDQRLSADADPVVADPCEAIAARLRSEMEAEFSARLSTAREAAHEEGLEQGRAAGYKEGLASGHADGKASATQAFQKKLELLDDVMAQADLQVDAWLQSLASQALDLSKQALCQLLGEQVLDTALLQGVIQRMTAELRPTDILAIHLHPAECALLRAALKQTPEAHGAARMGARLAEDNNLEAGGVVIDTPRGEYRATLDVLLRKLVALVDEQRLQMAPVAPVVHALRA